MDNKNSKNETLDSVLQLVILLPLGISVFSWLGIGTDIIIEYIYSYFKNSIAFKELFEIATSLFSNNENNPFITASEQRMRIVFMILIAIYIPTILFFYIIITVIKKYKK